MTKEILIQATPTARVTILCEEFLSDGLPHSRREIEQYVKSQLQYFGLPVPSQGHLSGGIYTIAQKEECIQPQRAMYQMNLSDTAPSSRLERARNYLDSAIGAITGIAHEIDYLTASDAELKELEVYKECILQIKAFNEKLAEM